MNTKTTKDEILQFGKKKLPALVLLSREIFIELDKMSTNNDEDEEGKDNDENEEIEKIEKIEKIAENEDVVEKKEVQKKDESDNFVYNDMLARALVQLFPREDRNLIHLWLEKLRSANVDNMEKLSNRNNYMWLLLSVLQNGSLVEPFAEEPPIDELPPLCDIIPEQMIEEMISSPENNFSTLDATSSDASVMDLKEEHSVGIPPHKFLEHQPRPVNGVSCYFSVFSRPT